MEVVKVVEKEVIKTVIKEAPRSSVTNKVFAERKPTIVDKRKSSQLESE